VEDLNHECKLKLGTRGSHLQSQLLGRLRLEGSWFKASMGKKLARLHLNTEKLGVVA
jgi:hypothetical protein